LVLLVLNFFATFAAALEVVHPAPESAGDTRFGYYWQLLARALTLTEPDFGPYVLRSATSAMTERRALEELMAGFGKIPCWCMAMWRTTEAIVAGLFSSRQGIVGLSRIPYPGETQSR
jgi:hypothetical protein